MSKESAAVALIAVVCLVFAGMKLTSSSTNEQAGSGQEFLEVPQLEVPQEQAGSEWAGLPE